MPTSVLLISFEVDISTGKVGGSLLIERRRRKLPRGPSPENFEIYMLGNTIFNIFQTVFGPQEQSKLNDYINHNLFYVYYNRSFPLSQSLAFRKEWNDKSSNADSKKYIQCFKFMLFLKKTCSAMSASVSLARTPFWHIRKPGIQPCENVLGVSTTLRSASTFYTFTKRLRRLKLLKCAFT